MRYQVLVTEDARRDVEEIHDHIARFDSPARADHVLDRLVEVAEGLTTSPERGAFPRELLALGIREYRQVFFKPFRVIYHRAPDVHNSDAAGILGQRFFWATVGVSGSDQRAAACVGDSRERPAARDPRPAHELALAHASRGPLEHRTG